MSQTKINPATEIQVPGDASKFLDGTGAFTTPPSGTGTVTGTGTTGQLAKWTGASAIGNADLTGDVTTSGSVATTLASVVTAGTNTKVTYSAKGLITSGAQAQFSD